MQFKQTWRLDEAPNDKDDGNYYREMQMLYNIADEHSEEADRDQDDGWNSDDDNVLEPGHQERSGGRFLPPCFFVVMGFHPYKEVIFLADPSTTVAYHLGSSKMQYLGPLIPKDRPGCHAAGVGSRSLTARASSTRSLPTTSPDAAEGSAVRTDMSTAPVTFVAVKPNAQIKLQKSGQTCLLPPLLYMLFAVAAPAPTCRFL